MDFYHNFSTLCAKAKTTPSTVLRQLNYSTSKLTIWKAGSLPKIEMLQLLATRLHCNISDFFEDNENYKMTDLCEDESELVDIYRRLGRKEKHLMMAYAYNLDQAHEPQAEVSSEP